MKIKYLPFSVPKIALLGLFMGISLALFPVFSFFGYSEKAEAELTYKILPREGKNLPLLEGNTLLAVSSPVTPVKIKKRIKMIITGYSSTPWETDSTPFLTASGAYVRDGIVANNLLAFGTKLMIPEIFGDKIFVVEDRMNQKAGNYHVDVWFPSYEGALSFGSKISYIEILE